MFWWMRKREKFELPLKEDELLSPLLQAENIGEYKIKKFIRLLPPICAGLCFTELFLQRLGERPSLLLLDEPMNGLDKEGVLEIRQLLRNLRDEGITIILSSHYVEDIEALCDTVSDMDKGVLTVGKEAGYDLQQPVSSEKE